MASTQELTLPPVLTPVREGQSLEQKELDVAATPAPQLELVLEPVTPRSVQSEHSDHTLSVRSNMGTKVYFEGEHTPVSLHPGDDLVALEHEILAFNPATADETQMRAHMEKAQIFVRMNSVRDDVSSIHDFSVASQHYGPVSNHHGDKLGPLPAIGGATPGNRHSPKRFFKQGQGLSPIPTSLGLGVNNSQTSLFSRMSANSVAENVDSIVQAMSAATVIQRRWRGVLGRRRYVAFAESVLDLEVVLSPIPDGRGAEENPGPGPETDESPVSKTKTREQETLPTLGS
mmetsp:Transcript_35127/g.110576  ORF Transcript_35127/g.110576 Transcript_35127/m.110576 type:complete len:288 (+) Transcript_35127:268-1131(+)